MTQHRGKESVDYLNVSSLRYLKMESTLTHKNQCGQPEGIPVITGAVLLENKQNNHSEQGAKPGSQNLQEESQYRLAQEWRYCNDDWEVIPVSKSMT